MFFHVNRFFVKKGYTLVFQKLPLNTRAAECKSGSHSSVAVDYSVARNDARFRIIMKRIADHPCPTGVACEKCDLTVGCNLALRNCAYYFIYLLECSNNYLSLSK